MKNILNKILLISILCSSIKTHGQSGEKRVEEEKFVCSLTDAYYNEHIAPRVRKNIDSLRLVGKISASNAKSALVPSVALAWPLRMTADHASTSGVYSYYRISNFRDLDAGPDMLDWMCNTGEAARTYNGHNGVDIAPKPFMWQAMDDQLVDVIAAADGIIVDFWGDGPFDRNCENPDLGDANFVEIVHSDGTITSYWHLKTGSLGNFNIGDSVVTGQFLGKVGSSGNSTNPHLHFGVSKDSGTGAIGYEPWYSPTGCNTLISESLWIDQKPYYDPAIQRISTHDAMPVYKVCSDYEAGENEDVYLCNHFNEGATMYINVGIRDYLGGESINVDILNSSSTVLESFSDISDDYDNSADIIFTADLDSYTNGQHRVRVDFNGLYYYHFFTVGCTNTYSLSGAYTGTRGWLAGDWITSTSTISGSSSNNIRYEAGNNITLNPGFHIASNAQLTAKINACTLGGAKVMQENTVQQNASLLLYPNPTEGECTIHFSASGTLSTNTFVRIINAEGNLIWENIMPADETLLYCDLSQFPKGLYTVTAQNETEFYTQKLMLQ